jgi:hypothetical protein
MRSKKREKQSQRNLLSINQNLNQKQKIQIKELESFQHP